MDIPSPKTRVHVHLDAGRSPERWREMHLKRRVFEESPYGYQWASPYVDLSYSADREEGRVVRFVRRGTAFILGCDLLHALRNRGRINECEVVWTHTEQEHLAIAMLKKVRLVDGPLIIGQTIWLWDRWRRMSPIRRALYRWLLREIAVHTTLSPTNASMGAAILGAPVIAVPYGIEPTFQVPFDRDDHSEVIRVLAPGNDRHRDWNTLAKAARANPGMQVLVLSRRRRARRAMSREVPNFVVEAAAGADRVIDAYRWADVIAIPLHPNGHASGVTVAFEALQAGRPVAITAVGGVEEYLRGDARYAVATEPDSLTAAINAAARDRTDGPLLERRRDRVVLAGLTARDYALRHVILTQHALGQEADLSVVSAFSPVRLSEAEEPAGQGPSTAEGGGGGRS